MKLVKSTLMNKGHIMKQLNLFLVAVGLVAATIAGSTLKSNQEEKTQLNYQDKAQNADEGSMQFGNFSVSLAVKDIQLSRDFYEKLDFKQVGGEQKQNWLVMQNGPTTIGLFQGMFEKNMMTFNPGWNKDKETLEDFDDVRTLQEKLKERGVKLTTEADEKSEGPASFMLADPDGNVILVDQHVAKPK